MFPDKLLWYFVISICRVSQAIEMDMIKLYNAIKLS